MRSLRTAVLVGVGISTTLVVTAALVGLYVDRKQHTPRPFTK